MKFKSFKESEEWRVKDKKRWDSLTDEEKHFRYIEMSNSDKTKYRLSYPIYPVSVP